jgi:hypothetical protein
MCDFCTIIWFELLATDEIDQNSQKHALSINCYMELAIKNTVHFIIFEDCVIRALYISKTYNKHMYV